MSDSTSHLDVLDFAQAGKETAANALLDGASPAILFARRPETCDGLVWGYFGGWMRVNGTLTEIANGTVTCSSSVSTYIEADSNGVVYATTGSFTPGLIPLYKTTGYGSGGISAWEDRRVWAVPSQVPQTASITLTTANVTLTEAQAACRFLNITGVLTGNRNVIVPNRWEGIVFNNNTGAFTTTVKTSAGTGKVITQGYRCHLYADGTNVERIAAEVNT